jgi:hypothetical protein
MLRWSDITTLFWAGAGQMAIPLSSVPPPLSRGATGGYGSGRHSVVELTPAFPHNTGDGRIVRVGGTMPGYDSQAVSEGRRGGDSPLTRAPAACQSI